MKREILFRGKRKDNGEWIYGDLITDGKNSPNKNMCHILPSDAVSYDFNECIHVSLKTVGQFTELKDKNGTKIFEGDLMKGFFCTSSTSKGKIKEFTFSVGFSPLNGYNVDLDYRIMGQYRFCPDMTTCEIVGNIHDNPELC